MRKEHGRDIDGACGQLRARANIMDFYAMTNIECNDKESRLAMAKK